MNLCRAAISIAFVLLCSVSAMAGRQISLDGPNWTFRTTLEDNAGPVAVPHCWSALEQYRRYIGSATYEHDFAAPELQPGEIVRLHFDAVYSHASVWLNGKHLGVHDGGYTPFEFNVTPILHPGQNHLLVEVNNTPTLESIPALGTSHGGGSTNYPLYGTASGERIVGWMPYGGIVRPVSLIVTRAIYIRNIKVDAKPDLKNGTAAISLRIWLHNAGDVPASVQWEGTVSGLQIGPRKSRVAPGQDVEVAWSGMLKQAHLWSVHDPYLYDAQVAVPGDELNTHLGVREIRVEGTELLLNGKPVHLFGANRVSEDNKEGLRESDAIIERDLGDMLADNMRMMRIGHYPQAPALLDFADRHGILIIAEAGNWNWSAWQMADPGIRATWKQQMREMMEQDWNHASVIAWSVGNEYESFTKEGIGWTHDMRAYTLGIDSGRLITFASRFMGDPSLKTGADEASQYSDFVCINVYGEGYGSFFDHVHKLYPNKPIFVSEFGKMGETGIHDPIRTKEITDVVTAIKARPWIIGGALWAWADYRSLIRGTPANGIRNWGMVTLDRDHRDSWEVVRRLFEMPLP